MVEVVDEVSEAAAGAQFAVIEGYEGAFWRFVSLLWRFADAGVEHMDAVRGDEDAAGLLFGHSVHCQRVNAGEGHCRQVAIHAPGQEARARRFVGAADENHADVGAPGEFASAERDEGRYAVLRQYHRVLLFAREMPRQDANAVEVGVAAHGQVSQVDGGVAERRVEGGRVGRIDRCLPALMAQGCQAQSHACFVL